MDKKFIFVYNEENKGAEVKNMAELKYEIVKKIGVLSETDKGWKKELNLVKWNDYAPKYDLRDWNEDHTRMGKGITLTEEEIKKLKESIENI